jgi:phage anti-repressor protein/arsenate reductase-like glutaredoxin family protein
MATYYNDKIVFTSGEIATAAGVSQFYVSNLRDKIPLKEGEDYYKLTREEVEQFKDGLTDVEDIARFSKIHCGIYLYTLSGQKAIVTHKLGGKHKTAEVLLPQAESALQVDTVDDIGIEDDRVDGRRLHAFLQVKTDYTHWVERMCEYGFTEGIDYLTKMTDRSDGQAGKPRTSHSMTIDMAKEISMLQRNERGKQARQYFIECEKRLKAQPQKPMTQSEIIAAMANQNVEMERRMALAEAKQEQQAKEIQTVRDTITLRPDETWREKTTKLINKIVEKLGGGANTHMEVRREIYNALNKRYGVCVDTRLRNKRERMREVGCSKSQINNTNILDVIAEDKKLVEGYITIIKEMAIKYGV